MVWTIRSCVMADLFQFEPHGLVRSIQRESSRVAPMEIRPPGFLIRGWSQEMWFRPLLGLGCVDSTDGAEQTDGRHLPPERPRWESNPRPPTCRPSALPTELVERVLEWHVHVQAAAHNSPRSRSPFEAEVCRRFEMLQIGYW